MIPRRIVPICMFFWVFFLAIALLPPPAPGSASPHLAAVINLEKLLEKAQLLVKRTILYLYARQDQQAWDTFNRDVSRYYVTAAWLPQLQQELIKVMGQHPY